MEGLLGAAAVLDSGLVQGLTHSLLAFSVVITLLSLDFPDLSIEGTYPFGAAITAVVLTTWSAPPVLALAVAFAGGCAAGLVTGLLHVRLQMSKLLSGISVAAMLYSVSLLVMAGRSNIPLLNVRTILSPFEAMDARFNEVFNIGSRYFYHPGTLIAVLLVFAVVLVAVRTILTSEFGVVLRAVGQNEQALPQYGRTPGRYKIAGVALGNGLAALAGSVNAQHQGFADVNMGIGVLVSSLVAVILGQELFSRFRAPLGSPGAVIVAAAVGAVVYQVMLAILLSIGVPPIALRFFAGFALVAVIAFGRRRSEVSFSW